MDSRRNVKKIFIQRDYSHGTGVRFSTDFPRELTGKVSTASTTAVVAVLIHTHNCESFGAIFLAGIAYYLRLI